MNETAPVISPADAVNERIRRTVKALRSAHGIKTADLALRIGVSRNSLFNRLSGTSPFLPAELAILADYFGCTIQDIYDGVVRLPDGPVGEAASEALTRRYVIDSATGLPTLCPSYTELRTTYEDPIENGEAEVHWLVADQPDEPRRSA